MVDLTPEPGPLIVSKAPTPGVSPAEIKQPYSEFANALDKSGEALGEVAKTTATQAGYAAVTRDADGNIQVQKAPIIGPASAEYSRAVKFAALAEGEASLKQGDIALRAQYRDQPDAYLKAAGDFRDEAVKKYTNAGGADLGITLGRSIDATTTQTFRGLQNESERLTLQRSEARIKSGIADSTDDLTALHRGGVTTGPAADAAWDKWHTLTDERVGNPRLAYPQEMADYDYQHLRGVLGSELAIHGTLQVYNDKSFSTTIDSDGAQTSAPNGGAAKAIEYANKILTDPSLKLTMPQRQAAHAQAISEIRQQETLRSGALRDLQSDHLELNQDIASGSQDPAIGQRAQDLIDRARALNSRSTAARLSSEYIKKDFYDPFGQQSLADRTQQLNSLQGGGALATSPGESRLIQHESGGNPTLVNKLGYAGTYQFGAPLLSDLGLYKPGAGENVGDKNVPGHPPWSGAKWSGTFNMPGFPQVKSIQDFLANPAAQKAAFDLHTSNMDAAISANGMDRFIGTKVGGVPMTLDGLHAMIHLGGVGGTMQTLASNGAVNPHDANGTSLLDYANMGATAGASNPANSMWLEAHRMRALSSDARNEWSAIKNDWTKNLAVPSPAKVDDITNALRTSGDFDGLSTVSHDQYLFDKVHQGEQLPAADRHALITEYERRSASGQMKPEDADILQGLKHVDATVNKNLAENPIQSTVTRFPNQFQTPAPLNVKDPQQLAVGLGQRALIAQFAGRTEGHPVGALDKADLAQVTAALDTPDPKVKGQIFAAIASALPQDVRDATLSKIGEKRPDFMVSAAAGNLMKEAPDVAQSILRGQEALGVKEGNGTNARSAYAVQSAQDWNDELNKTTVLPSTAFSLAARSDPSGGYAVARDMIRARYADISAQKGDTSGKIDADRVKQAADDVTGGILYHNSTPFIAPQRGMPQTTFDSLLYGVTDNDMAGVTTLNGAPVSADYLRDKAQLESFGQGRYLVRLGKEPMRPIYAFTGANSASPQKFVLDLRNRSVGPVTLGAAELNQSAGFGP
jgi:hypothetical protein